jgi:hypothetical protein
MQTPVGRLKYLPTPLVRFCYLLWAGRGGTQPRNWLWGQLRWHAGYMDATQSEPSQTTHKCTHPPICMFDAVWILIGVSCGVLYFRK